MKKSILAAAAVIALSASAPAHAMMTCAKDYKDFWEKLMPNGPAAKLTGEQLAGATRAALRAYDACQAGDEQWAKDVFAKVGQQIKKNER